MSTPSLNIIKLEKNQGDGRVNVKHDYYMYYRTLAFN